MNFGKAKHQQKLEEACKTLEAEGYTVLKIGKRIPDAIAIKGEIVLVEVIQQGETKGAKREYAAAFGNIPLRVFTFKGCHFDFQHYCDHEP